MDIFRDFDEIQFDNNTVLTVGTFDGVHLGHQKILRRLLDISTKENLRNLVITLDPHPQIVIKKENRPKISLLTTIDERLKLLEKFNVQNTLVINFTYEFSQTPPETFIKDYLIKQIGFKKILIGHDHLFGKNRGGNQQLLEQLSKEYSFEIEKVDPLIISDIIVSSTKIRNLINEKKIEIANKLLGYKYFINGVVIKGDQRGRKLGFPTANIEVNSPDKLIPPIGVYLVSIEIERNNYYGMANIGYRPTFDNNNKLTIEVNIFDFDQDIYGKHITMYFIKYLREEIKFNSIDNLLKQMQKDKENCIAILKNSIAI